MWVSFYLIELQLAAIRSGWRSNIHGLPIRSCGNSWKCVMFVGITVEEEVRSNALSGVKTNGKIGRACCIGLLRGREMPFKPRLARASSKDKSCTTNVLSDKQNHDDLHRDSYFDRRADDNFMLGVETHWNPRATSMRSHFDATAVVETDVIPTSLNFHVINTRSSLYWSYLSR